MDDYFLNEAIDDQVFGYRPYRREYRKREFMAKNTIVFAEGTLYWFKGLNKGQAVQNYDGDGYEWTFELEPEDTGFLKEHKLLDRLKDPMDYANKLKKMIKSEDDPKAIRELEEKLEKAEQNAEGRDDYLIIRKPTQTKDGDETDPFRVYDEDNEPWDTDTLIGNGSKAVCKLKIVDWGPGKKQSIYCLAIRVTDHVPYETDEFAEYDKKDDTPKAKPKKGRAKKADPKGKSEELDELDDDIPF